MGLSTGWQPVDRQLVLEWRKFKATQLCPVCGIPGWFHTQDKAPGHYATGYTDCTVTEALARAKDGYAKSPAGQREAKAVKAGAPNPDAWRRWLYWDADQPTPTYLPLD